MVMEVVQVATFTPTPSRLVQPLSMVKPLSWPQPSAPNSSKIVTTTGCLAYHSTRSTRVLIISSSADDDQLGLESANTNSYP